MSDKKPKFLRRDSARYSRLGRNRKNKQKWKRPTGRDNKMREKRRGYPATVSIGYHKTVNAEKKGKEDKIIELKSVTDLEKIGKGGIITLGKMGKKKKLIIAKKALESGIEIQNLNADKFIKMNSISKKPAKIEDKGRENKTEEGKK